MKSLLVSINFNDKQIAYFDLEGEFYAGPDLHN